MSDTTYARYILENLAKHRNLVVINDEAHHAWRQNFEQAGRVKKTDKQRATIWVKGLDRIHKVKKLLMCYEFTATPYSPTFNQSSKGKLFNWVVSDFGLSDAIESGLVKTPCVVATDNTVQDDTKSKLFHLFNVEEVKSDLKRSNAKPNEPIPDLVIDAYNLLAKDWKSTKEAWDKQEVRKERRVPPVMISVANKIQTAKRIEQTFLSKRSILVEDICDKDRILRIDSSMLNKAELNKGAKREQELRTIINTVGKPGKPGAHLQNLISVEMLSEGWDANNVTHILGLRPFSSQLLCEQVVGRGLRRRSYDVDLADGLLKPEYVRVIGVPFALLPHQEIDSEEDNGPTSPVAPDIEIFADKDKSEFQISWPNVIRIDSIMKDHLSLDLDQIDVLTLDGSKRITSANLGATIDGNPDIRTMSTVDLFELASTYRTQTIVFQTVAEVLNSNDISQQPLWKSNKSYLIAQIVRFAYRFIRSNKIRIIPEQYAEDSQKRRLLIILSMNKIVRHFWEAIKSQSVEHLDITLNANRSISSTGDMRNWWTRRPTVEAPNSHINLCVVDSSWERAAAKVLSEHKAVQAWVKNDHLGYYVNYMYKGKVRRYIPDFLIRLHNDEMLVLEIKGQPSEESDAKKAALEEWCRALNYQVRFGKWHSAIAYSSMKTRYILDRFL